VTNLLGTLQLTALAGLGFVLLVALLFVALRPMLPGLLRNKPPAQRARILFLYAGAPVLAAIALTALCFLPSVLAVVGLGSDHCGTHGHHDHLCFLHLADSAGSSLGWLMLAAAFAWPATEAIRQTRALVRARRPLEVLALMSTRSRDGVHVVASTLPFSFAAGILRQRVFVSSGLRDRLLQEELSVVLDHERAHVRRRDGLRKVVARLVSTGHLPHVRRWLIEALDLACEQACDEEAAQRAGDRLRVARAIVAVEQGMSGLPAELTTAASSFGGSNVAARVEALLDEPPVARPAAWPVWWVVGAVALAGTGWIHHVAETVAGFLVD
jgi:Zn-dependent protease with chaperone function